MAEVRSLRRGEVALRDLSKSFQINGRPLSVLRNLNLDIRSGECLAIVGASGSGKTTLLRVLAGLETADAGRVLIDGRPVSGVGRERAVIFQEPRLLPWLTVLGNVAFGLKVRGGIRTRRAACTSLHLACRPCRFPGCLSETAIGWNGTAGRACASADGKARDPAARRAAGRPRCDDETDDAAGARAHLAGGERDDGSCHARSREAIYLADRVLILPKQKDGAPRAIDIDLPRPRDRSGARFVRYRQELLREFGLH